jgi:hypothetical protein
MKLKNKFALPRKCARRAIGDKIMTWGQRHERDHNLLNRCLYRPLHIVARYAMLMGRQANPSAAIGRQA